jgi:hypothetical protein
MKDAGSQRPNLVEIMAAEIGIRLEFSDGRPALTSLPEANAAMAAVGAGVWPLDLTGEPVDIQHLFRQPTLTDAEEERLKAHFLLSRERLLEVIARAGRKPHVEGGGALSTSVVSHGYSYPQLWVVQGGIDYSRFDRFHVNVADDGAGVDEVLQILSGRGIVIRQRLPNGGFFSLRLDCPADNAGWLVTYDGGNPHIGSLSAAAPGTKALVQAIGPERWSVRYES